MGIQLIDKFVYDACVIGMGPAGIGATLRMLENGKDKSIVCVEAGNDPWSRNCHLRENPNLIRRDYYLPEERATDLCIVNANNKQVGHSCEVISGFGGCSFVSGGKLSLFPAGKNLSNIIKSEEQTKSSLLSSLNFFKNYVTISDSKSTSEVIKRGEQFFQNMGFNYKYYDSFTFDPWELTNSLKSVYVDFEKKGVKILTRTKFINLSFKNEVFEVELETLDLNVEPKISKIYSKKVFLALGRSGRNKLWELSTKLKLPSVKNHVDIGLRLEFPKDMNDFIDKYHNDLKLFYKDSRTFCVCTSGKVSPYYLNGIFYTEGHQSPNFKTDFTNFAITVRIPQSKESNDLMKFVENASVKHFSGLIAKQSLTSFLGIENGTKEPKITGTLPMEISKVGDICNLYPKDVCATLKSAVNYISQKFFDQESLGDINVYGPEMDYGGLRFELNSDFSIMPNLYMIGDCTGQFRGILQAFTSGWESVGGKDETKG